MVYHHKFNESTFDSNSYISVIMNQQSIQLATKPSICCPHHLLQRCTVGGGHWWTRDIYPITAEVEDKRNSSSNNGTEVSVLDQVFCAVSTVECQAASSWSTRDHTVLSEIPELTRESDPVQFQRRQHPLLNLHLLGFRSGLDIIEKPTMKCPAAR